jgi:hypothetical protein
MTQIATYNPTSIYGRISRRIVATTAKATASAVYEIPRDRSLRMTNITICNTSSSRVTIRLHHVGAGETANVGNALFYDLEMQGNTTISDDSLRFFNAGDKIFAQASTASVVSFIVYGEEI